MLSSATVDALPALGGRAKPKPINGVDGAVSCIDLHMALMNGTNVVSKCRVGQYFARSGSFHISMATSCGP
ncbi:hypothetical protein D3C76_1432830 [compost metagenome]